MKLEGGGLEYEGGETRLVQVPNFCHHQELLEALERLAGFGHQSSGESSEGGVRVLLPRTPLVPNTGLPQQSLATPVCSIHCLGSPLLGYALCHTFSSILRKAFISQLCLMLMTISCIHEEQRQSSWIWGLDSSLCCNEGIYSLKLLFSAGSFIEIPAAYRTKCIRRLSGRHRHRAHV